MAAKKRLLKKILAPLLTLLAAALTGYKMCIRDRSGGIPDGLPAAGPLRGKNKSFLRNAGPGDLVEIGRVIGYNKNIQLKFMEAST